MAPGVRFIIVCPFGLSEYYAQLLTMYHNLDSTNIRYIYSLTITTERYVSPYCNAGIIVVEFYESVECDDVLTHKGKAEVYEFTDKHVKAIGRCAPILKFVAFKTGALPRVITTMFRINNIALYDWESVGSIDITYEHDITELYTASLKETYVMLVNMKITEDAAQSSEILKSKDDTLPLANFELIPWINLMF